MTRFQLRDGAPGQAPISILAVGLAERTGAALGQLLKPFEFRLRFADDSQHTWALVEIERPELLVVDASMPHAASLLRTSDERLGLPSVVLCRRDVDRPLLVELLAAGALDALPSDLLEASPSRELPDARGVFLDALRDASAARLHARRLGTAARRSLSGELFLGVRVPGAGQELPTLVAVAGATGALDALRFMLAGLPDDAPGLIVAQHGSHAFVEAARAELAGACRVRVRVARHGDRVEPGLVLLAPGGRHMRAVRRGSGYRVSISDGPLVARHRPSADVLLQSASEAAGNATIGVILSGTGQDGCDGAAAVKRCRGAMFAQDAATSIAFGMPGAAVARGVVDVSAAHTHLPALLMQRAIGPRGRA